MTAAFGQALESVEAAPARTSKAQVTLAFGEERGCAKFDVEPWMLSIYRTEVRPAASTDLTSRVMIVEQQGQCRISEIAEVPLRTRVCKRPHGMATTSALGCDDYLMVAANGGYLVDDFFRLREGYLSQESTPACVGRTLDQR